MEIKMEINVEKVEKERIKWGFSQSEFALHIGFTRQAYALFLKNKSTKLSTLRKIADILDVDPKDLLKDN